MSLQATADDMKKVAQKNPHDHTINPICPEVCFQEMDYQGQKIPTIFSLDVYPGGRSAWHLTITPKRPLTPAQISEVLLAFFGTDTLGKSMDEGLKGKLMDMTQEISRMFPLPEGQRQYVQLRG